jgi:hypothetical protein
MTGNALEAAPSESRADGPSRQIAKLARDPAFSLVKALAALPAGGARYIPETIAQYERALTPLRSSEPAFDGSLAKSVANAFAPIGAKMRPDMSQEQAMVWCAALVKALSDLPPRCVIAAFDEAVHIPFEFASQMEAKVREIAERKRQEHWIALSRLRQMQAEILRAAAPPQPQLEGPPDEPMSREELRKLRKTAAGPNLIRMGLSAGFVLQADLDALEAEDAEERAHL